MSHAPATPGRLRVVTWNIRAAIGPGEPFPPAWWMRVDDDRLERIAAFLDALAPDVLTLQEVAILNADGRVVDQPAALAIRLRRHVRYGAAHAYPLVDPGSGETVGSAMWGNAILARDPLGDGSVRGLPQPGDDELIEPEGSGRRAAGVRYGGAEPGHREPRCAVSATVGGVRVVTTHLAYIGAEQRRRQAETVARFASSGPAVLGRGMVDDRADAIVVTGDLNAPIEAPELRALDSSFQDAFAAVDIAAGDARRRSCGSIAIDHVLVRGLEVESCRVATEAGDLSDHWPVVVDLARS